MRIILIAVGTRPPGWVKDGYGTFAKRLPPECRLELVQISPAKRGKQGGQDAVDQEGAKLLAAVPKGARVLALDEGGQAWSTAQLARSLEQWLQAGRDLALLVGGADGLAAACRERAEAVWSLSQLTLPHMLVRVVVAEQLYRAWSMLQGKSYHRG